MARTPPKPPLGLNPGYGIAAPLKNILRRGYHIEANLFVHGGQRHSRAWTSTELDSSIALRRHLKAAKASSTCSL